MTESKISLTCPACQATLRVPRRLVGSEGTCPRCQTRIAFSLPAARDGAKIRQTCKGCGAIVVAPAHMAGKEVSCPKCGLSAIISSPANAGLVVKDEPLAPPRQQVDPKAFNAWEVLQRGQEDSFWIAQWKALLYPYEALGALIFFVIGIPLAIAIMEAVAKASLKWAGGELETSEKTAFFAAGVTAISLAVPLALIAFFASFLFAVVRTAAAGRQAKPVIEGMHHRSNLAAICAWAALYFGPALYLGFRYAETGQFFSWNPASVVALCLLGLLAPMGLLCSATVSANASLNLIQVIRGIAAFPGRYLYVLLIIAVATGIFVSLGLWCGDKATACLSAKPPDYAWGIILRVACGIFFLFPLVIAARCLGLLLKYDQDRLPFTIDLFSEHKGGAIPNIVALAGVMALFLPLYQEAKLFAERGGKTVTAEKHLLEIYEKCLYEGEFGNRTPQTYQELENLAEKYLGSKDALRCPAKPDVYPMYELIPLDQEARRKTPFFIWIYEREATGPDGESFNALRANGIVVSIRNRQRLEELLSIQKRYAEEKDNAIREQIYREYTKKAGLF